MAPDTNDTPVAMIRLRHPELAGLQYGPDTDSAIVFGPRSGNPEFEAWIPEDHPLLPDLLTAHPEVQIVTASGPAIMWACPFHPDQTFKTKNALLAHMKGAKGHDVGSIGEALGLLKPIDPTDDGSGIHVSPTSNVVQQDPVSPPPAQGQRPAFGG